MWLAGGGGGCVFECHEGLGLHYGIFVSGGSRHEVKYCFLWMDSMSLGQEHEKSTDVVMQDARKATLGPEFRVLGHGMTLDWVVLLVQSGSGRTVLSNTWMSVKRGHAHACGNRPRCSDRLDQLNPITPNRNPLTTAATSSRRYRANGPHHHDRTCWSRLGLTRRDTGLLCGSVYVVVSARISEQPMQGRQPSHSGAHVPRLTSGLIQAWKFSWLFSGPKWILGN